jgi:hypothetical protein
MAGAGEDEATRFFWRGGGRRGNRNGGSGRRLSSVCVCAAKPIHHGSTRLLRIYAYASRSRRSDDDALFVESRVSMIGERGAADGKIQPPLSRRLSSTLPIQVVLFIAWPCLHSFFACSAASTKTHLASIPSSLRLVIAAAAHTMATRQIGLSRSVKPARAGPGLVARHHRVARTMVAPRAVAEPQQLATPANGVPRTPSLAGWTPESWRSRVALQVRRFGGRRIDARETAAAVCCCCARITALHAHTQPRARARMGGSSVDVLLV